MKDHRVMRLAVVPLLSCQLGGFAVCAQSGPLIPSESSISGAPLCAGTGAGSALWYIDGDTARVLGGLIPDGVGSATHEVAVPNDLSLCGRDMVLQACLRNAALPHHFQGGSATNALFATLGEF